MYGYMVALQSGQFDVFFFRRAGKRDSCAESWFSTAVGFFAKHSSCLMLSAYNKYIYGKLICWYLPYMRFGLVSFGTQFLCPRLRLLLVIYVHISYFFERKTTEFCSVRNVNFKSVVALSTMFLESNFQSNVEQMILHFHFQHFNYTFRTTKHFRFKNNFQFWNSVQFLSINYVAVEKKWLKYTMLIRKIPSKF